jgi:hypothetical protein
MVVFLGVLLGPGVFGLLGTANLEAAHHFGGRVVIMALLGWISTGLGQVPVEVYRLRRGWAGPGKWLGLGVLRSFGGLATLWIAVMLAMHVLHLTAREGVSLLATGAFTALWPIPRLFPARAIARWFERRPASRPSSPPTAAFPLGPDRVRVRITRENGRVTGTEVR